MTYICRSYDCLCRKSRRIYRYIIWTSNSLQVFLDSRSSLRKPLAFLYIRNNKLENVIEKEILSTIATKP